MAVTWKQIPFADEVATLSATTPSAISAAAGSAGAGTSASKYDHTHQVSVASPTGIDGVTADGTSTSLARADHKHAFAAHAANDDFAGYQALNLVLHSTASAPSTPVVGKAYYNTGDSHVYVCTSAA